MNTKELELFERLFTEGHIKKYKFDKFVEIR